MSGFNVIVYPYRPSSSGIASYTLNLANCLQYAGHDVKLVGYSLSNAHSELNPAIRTIELGRDLSYLDYIGGPSYVYANIRRKLRRVFASETHDIIHSVLPPATLNSLNGVSLMTIWSVPSLIKIMKWSPILNKGMGRLLVLAGSLEYLVEEKLSYLRVDGIVSTTSYYARKLAMSLKRRVTYIPMPVEVQEKPSQLSDKLRVIMAERDLERPRNNCLTLLKALKMIIANGLTKKIKVRLIGQGPRLVSIVETMKKSGLDIDMLMPIPHRTFLNLLTENDIFISIRTIFEQGGFAPLEAMSRGNVIIVSNSPAYGDLVINGYNGYVIDEHDHMSLAKLLAFLSENMDVLSKIKTNAWQLAKTVHSYENVGTLLTNLYREVLNDQVIQ